MRGSSSTAVFRSTWLLIGTLLLVATGCAIAPPREGTAPGVVAPTPTLDALDPCASARTNRSMEPNSAQAVALADFIRWSRFPVRDARSLPIINDGAFARVVVCAQVRHGLTDVWDEFSGEYALAFTRDQWSVQKSPLDRMDGFVSVKAEATRQAAEQAATEKVLAALSARTAISATVVGITEVRDIPADSSYSKVTLELQSTDGKQHTVVFWPNFRATMRQCATKSLEGAESIMSISGLFSAQPKETIGREPIQRDYAFKAAQNPWHGVFARPNCQILTDARDLKLTIDQIDGFEAYRLEAAARQLADATATPIPVPTVLAVATEVLPSPTMIVSVEPAPATASGGVSLPDFSPVLFVVPVALIAAVVLGRTLLVRRVSWSRAAPRHSRAEEPRVMDASAPEPGEQHAERATEASVHPVGDTGPVVAAPVGVTLSAVSAPLVVKCFGALHVAHADRVLWPAREFAHEQRAWELLFFLAASPSEGVDRELVGAALWPEVDLADVAGSLRQLRRRLRQMLVRAVPGLPEGAPLEADTGRIYRLDTNLVCSDAHRFTALLRIAKSDNASALGTLEQAYGLYEADLLDSPTAPPFAWALDPGDDGTSLRQRYRRQFLDMCRTLADLHAAGGQGAYVERGIDLYRRLVQADPLDERTWRALLSAHAKRRDKAALDREWQRLTEALHAADTDASPEAETSAVYQRLMAAE